jgi:hypothetical protein
MAKAVRPFLRLANDECGLLEVWHGRDQLRSQCRVAAHDRLLFGGERRRLPNQRVGHRQLAEIVQQRGPPHRDDVRFRQSHRAGDTHREHRHATGVGMPLRRPRHQRRRHPVDPFLRIDRHRRNRLAEIVVAALDLRLEARAPAPAIARASVPVDRAEDRVAEPLPPEGLGQVVDDPLLNPGCRGGRVLNAAGHDDRGVGMLLADAIGEPQPVVAGHPDVTEGNRRRRRFHHPQRFVGTGRAGHGVAASVQPSAHQIAHAILVVDDQH